MTTARVMADDIPVAFTPPGGWTGDMPPPVLGVHDVAELDKTTPIEVVATFEDGVHVLRPVGLPVEVRRWVVDGCLMWRYVGFTARLERA